MKIYACPTEVTRPEPDFKNYNWEKESRVDREHAHKLKNWLISNGYKGKNTGKVVSFGVADGCAQYMIAEGKVSCLIHLKYGDAYKYPDAKYLPKSEIVRRGREIDEAI
jgi:hypothetical protein